MSPLNVVGINIASDCPPNHHCPQSDGHWAVPREKLAAFGSQNELERLRSPCSALLHLFQYCWDDLFLMAVKKSLNCQESVREGNWGKQAVGSFQASYCWVRVCPSRLCFPVPQIALHQKKPKKTPKKPQTKPNQEKWLYLVLTTVFPFFPFMNTIITFSLSCHSFNWSDFTSLAKKMRSTWDLLVLFECSVAETEIFPLDLDSEKLELRTS